MVPEAQPKILATSSPIGSVDSSSSPVPTGHSQIAPAAAPSRTSPPRTRSKSKDSRRQSQPPPATPRVVSRGTRSGSVETTSSRKRSSTLAPSDDEDGRENKRRRTVTNSAILPKDIAKVVDREQFPNILLHDVIRGQFKRISLKPVWVQMVSRPRRPVLLPNRLP